MLVCHAVSGCLAHGSHCQLPAAGCNHLPKGHLHKTLHHLVHLSDRCPPVISIHTVYRPTGPSREDYPKPGLPSPHGAIDHQARRPWRPRRFETSNDKLPVSPGINSGPMTLHHPSANLNVSLTHTPSITSLLDTPNVCVDPVFGPQRCA